MRPQGDMPTFGGAGVMLNFKVAGGDGEDRAALKLGGYRDDGIGE